MPAIQTITGVNSSNDRGEPNFASFEVKAGEIVVIDSISLNNISWDVYNCALIEGTNNTYSCPITEIDLKYIPRSYYKLNDFLKKNLSDQQSARIVRRPIKLGVLVSGNPSKQDKNGFDIYTVKKK